MISLILSFNLCAHESWEPTAYSSIDAHAPTPLPDRVVLTWEEDTATTQSVSWRTDTTIKQGMAQLAVANSNGRALKPKSFNAKTTFLQTDLNDSHYHTVIFRDLEPDTLYAYRVGDGVNFTEYYHFKTATKGDEPFSFIYFGDAQNEVRTHWSRVFREAFRDAPRAAFTLHAGDLVNRKYSDSEWGEWHQGPDWVNGTIPVIATPGNHEYFNYDKQSNAEFYWTDKGGDDVEILVTSMVEEANDQGKIYKISLLASDSEKISIEFNDSGVITQADDQIEVVTGFSKKQLLGQNLYGPPLFNRQRKPEQASLSNHWSAQFAFPVQNVPDPALAETVYYIDYQGVRFISLDSNNARTGQIASKEIVNIPEGYEKAYDPNIGTVNVVSVSGPKMYKITKGAFAKRMEEDTQLYQIIDVNESRLRFRAFKATGELYDEFSLKKREGKPNLLVEG